MAELERQGLRQVIGVEGLLPRRLYEYRIDLERVLDLTERRTREHLGISIDELTSEDLELPRVLGEAAHAAGFQAIRSPSATGVGEILAVFPEFVSSDRMRPRVAEQWDAPRDLRPS